MLITASIVLAAFVAGIDNWRQRGVQCWNEHR
jgi:hypothetical protein